MNAYAMMEQIRRIVGEGTAKHWTDLEILRALNMVQLNWAIKVSKAPGDWLVTDTTLTAASSVITLPSDCSKVIYLERASSGEQIPIRLTIRERRKGRFAGSNYYEGNLEAYFVGNTLEVNQDSFSESVNLWYEKRVPELHFGAAGSGSGALALELDATLFPKRVDDYYNGVVVEVVDGTGAGIVSTISDYATATKVATITGTTASGAHYGTVSVLPEETWPAILWQAAKDLLVKPGVSLDEKYYQYVRDTAKDYAAEATEWLTSRYKGSNHVRISED